MVGMLRTLQLLVVAAVLAAGGLAFLWWRDRADKTWIFLGSPDRIDLDDIGLDWMLDPTGYRVEAKTPVRHSAIPVAHVR